MESFGKYFKLEELLKARSLALKSLDQIRSKVYAGISEEEGHQIIKEVCLENGAEKFWHPSKFRISSDTTKSFREKSEQRKPLSEGDLYFVDFGPVFLGHEADLGDTFQLGNSHFENPAKSIFNELKNEWHKNRTSGQELYEKGFQLARGRELEFNKQMVGHRISDFPHALHYRGSLESCETTPLNGAWILEVHLIDHKNNCGYFFEDILLEN